MRNHISIHPRDKYSARASNDPDLCSQKSWCIFRTGQGQHLHLSSFNAAYGLISHTPRTVAPLGSPNHPVLPVSGWASGLRGSNNAPPMAFENKGKFGMDRVGMEWAGKEGMGKEGENAEERWAHPPRHQSDPKPRTRILFQLHHQDRSFAAARNGWLDEWPQNTHSMIVK